MLFLVKGPLRHEAVWQAWFERAAGLLPAQAVSNALCASEARMPAALAACSSLAGGEALVGQGVLHRQHLFDVYVHPHPNFTGGCLLDGCWGRGGCSRGMYMCQGGLARVLISGRSAGSGLDPGVPLAADWVSGGAWVCLGGCGGWVHSSPSPSLGQT
jgi:hypothetical protein